MGLCHKYRIYDRAYCHSVPKRRKNKGTKRKVRRMYKAWHSDGWERKQAGGLSPQHRPSKQQLRRELYECCIS